jgi:hypothetical protein
MEKTGISRFSSMGPEARATGPQSPINTPNLVPARLPCHLPSLPPTQSLPVPARHSLSGLFITVLWLPPPTSPSSARSFPRIPGPIPGFERGNIRFSRLQPSSTNVIP